MPSKPTPDQRLDDMAQEIVQMTDAFCGVYLTSECGDLCQDLAIALKTDHPSLLDSGRAKSWAAAVVYTVARVNFLFDPYTDPHMSATDLCRKLGVSQKTFCVIGLANAEEPRHHCISVGFVHNPPEITVNAYGHRLSAIFRALSRKRSFVLDPRTGHEFDGRYLRHSAPTMPGGLIRHWISNSSGVR